MIRNRLQKQPVLSYVPAVPAVPARPAYCETYQEFIGYREAQKKTDGPEGFFVSASGTDIEMGFLQGSMPVTATPVYKRVERPFSANMMDGVEGVDWYYDFSLGDGKIYEDVLIGWIIRPNVPPGYTAPRTPVYRSVTQCYPAIPMVPGIPGKIDGYESNGWNGGARSIDQVPVGGYFEVEIKPEPLAILIGLSDGQFDHSYGHPTHGLVLRLSGITPIESGADVGAEVASGSVVRLARTETGVRMFVDGELVHESFTPIIGPAYADATLYALSDYAQNPKIGVFAVLEGTGSMLMEGALTYGIIGDLMSGGGIGTLDMQGEAIALLDGISLLSGVGTFSMYGEGQPFAQYDITGDGEALLDGSVDGYGMFGPRQMLVGMNGGQARMVASGFGSDSNAARGSGVFSPPSLTARAGRPEADLSQAVGVFPSPLLTAIAYNGAVASGSGEMVARGKGADNEYAYGNAPAATAYRITAWEPYWPDDKMDGGELLFANDRLDMKIIQLFLIQEGMEVSDGLSLYVMVSLDFYDAIAVDDDFDFSTIISLMISERVAVNDRAVAARQALQYAVNATTGALSRYEGFGFTQFATLRGITYGIKDGALYRLQGDTDDGDTLGAHIDFGASDFGTAQGKRISSVYAGIATDGEVYLRVAGDDGDEQVYRARGEDPERRAMTAKGLVSRHWRLRLELADASYADLDNVEIEIGVSQRRLRSRR